MRQWLKPESVVETHRVVIDRVHNDGQRGYTFGSRDASSKGVEE